jgi:hypothetical protein
LKVRKINDDILQQMLKEKKSQRECALFFQVSDAAISKRIQRLKLMQLPESMDKLTPQQQRFVLIKAGGASNLEAAQASFDCSNTDVAKSIGCKLMSEPDINVAIRDILAQEGYPIRKRLKRLGQLIDCADLTVAGKGLDMSFKLDGSYAPQHLEIPDYHAIAAEVTRGIIETTLAIRRFEEQQEKQANAVTIDEVKPETKGEESDKTDKI